MKKLTKNQKYMIGAGIAAIAIIYIYKKRKANGNMTNYTGPWNDFSGGFLGSSSHVTPAQMASCESLKSQYTHWVSEYQNYNAHPQAVSKASMKNNIASIAKHLVAAGCGRVIDYPIPA